MLPPHPHNLIPEYAPVLYACIDKPERSGETGERWRLKASFLLTYISHGFYIRWLRTNDENKVFFGFDDSFDVTKCLQQIEKSDLLHVCA